jgi:cell division protein FtsQ
MARPSAATARLPVPLPADVRLMNAVAGIVYLLAALALGAAALLWLARSPWFAIRAVQLDGDLARNNVLTIRANAVPRLAGNFFSLDLQQAKEAFEAVPWVRRAVVRRIWPDRLAVRLEEHRAAALWRGAEGDEPRLVNGFGEVFEANLGDVEDEDLPALEGPEDSAAQMLALQRRLQPLLARLELSVQTLALSGRGSWRAQLDSGATLELGRGSEDEVVARVERFVRTLTQVTGRYRAALESADLRHADGYALRLQGIKTMTPASDRKAN